MTIQYFGSVGQVDSRKVFAKTACDDAKTTWCDFEEYSGLEINFFSSRSSALRATEYKEAKLTATPDSPATRLHVRAATHSPGAAGTLLSLANSQDSGSGSGLLIALAAMRR